MPDHQRTCAAAIAVLCGGTVSAPAQSVADFYRGKTIQLIIPSNMGGSVGLYGKLVADHIGRHIPGNPTVILIADAGRRRAAVGRVHLPGRAARTAPSIAEILSPVAAGAADAQHALRFRRSCNGSDRSPRGPASSASGTPRRDHARRRQAGRAEHGVDRRRLRQLLDPDARQRRARHQIQAGDRLSRRRRHQSRDRAPRDRRPLELLVRLDHGEAGLDPRGQAEIPVPHRPEGAGHARPAVVRRADQRRGAADGANPRRARRRRRRLLSWRRASRPIARRRCARRSGR